MIYPGNEENGGTAEIMMMLMIMMMIAVLVITMKMRILKTNGCLSRDNLARTFFLFFFF